MFYEKSDEFEKRSTVALSVYPAMHACVFMFKVQEKKNELNSTQGVSFHSTTNYGRNWNYTSYKRRLRNKVDAICSVENDEKSSNDITKIWDKIIKLKQDINLISYRLVDYDLELYTEDTRLLLEFVQEMFNDQSNHSDIMLFLQFKTTA